MLVCIRVPETDGDHDNLFTGQIGYPLTNPGSVHARELAHDLKGLDHVFSSPSTGAVQFAEMFGSFSVVPEFHDRSGGEYEGRSWLTLKKELPPKRYKLWNRDWFAKPPRGESYYEISERVIKAYERIVRPRLRQGDNIGIVSHTDPLRVLLGHLSGKNEDDILKMEIHPIPYVFHGPF